MSALQLTIPKRGAPTLSLNIAPRPSTPQVECLSNKENYPEVSTPQLPKKTPFNSRISLSVKKSAFSSQPCPQESEGSTTEDYPEVSTPQLPKKTLFNSKTSRKSTFASQQCPQQAEHAVEVSFDKESVVEIQKVTPIEEPKSALLKKKKAEMSFCGDESPLVVETTTSNSPLVPIERDYNEELYKRAEEYLDSLHFVIVYPEDHRRRPFGNLRVSTARVPVTDSGTPEYNSPSLISPSIHTSSLIQRRSSSKKLDSDSTPARQKLALAKSPFYNCIKGKRLFGDSTTNQEINTEIEDDSAPEGSNLSVVTSLNVKFTGMSLRASREPSDSSVTSFKVEEDSPLKISV